jgi:uncharacterized protein (TIGR01244 family)
MSEFKHVTPDFAVASQLDVATSRVLRTKGSRTIIVNRPDGEAPGQPSASEIKAAAEARG